MKNVKQPRAVDDLLTYASTKCDEREQDAFASRGWNQGAEIGNQPLRVIGEKTPVLVSSKSPIRQVPAEPIVPPSADVSLAGVN